jgi:hypothetical protein
MGTERNIPPERTELHNASVDDTIAAAGRCATVHLPTGRVCIRDHHHRGSCEFAPHEEAHSAVRASAGRPANVPDAE